MAEMEGMNSSIQLNMDVPKVLFLSLVTFSGSQNSMGVFHSFVSSDHIGLVQEWVFIC